MNSDPSAADHRNVSAFRRYGYSVFPGDSFSYLLHMRPREWPIMAVHTALGCVLAFGSQPDVVESQLPRAVLALIIWVVALNGGTLALNSAFDADEGDVGYLDAPPPPPRYLAQFGVMLMLLGQAAALAIGIAFATAYCICLVLSLAYSVPPIRLKAVAGADWLVNVVGFGSLTPLAGWLATGAVVTAPAVLVFVGFGALFAALYPATQLYQVEEDRARGDRTLVIALGNRASLVLAIAFVLLAFTSFAFGIVSHVGGGRAVILVLMLGALACWASVLVPWIKQSHRLSVAAHKAKMYAALGAWAATDAAVILSWMFA